MLEAGTKAPSFTLPDKDGKLVSLEDFFNYFFIYFVTSINCYTLII